jgi:hypothetical protein
MLMHRPYLRDMMVGVVVYDESMQRGMCYLCACGWMEVVTWGNN